MSAAADKAFRAKLEVLLGERKGAEQDRAVRLKEIGAILRNSTALSGTIDPAIIKPIVDRAVDDALVGWTPPDWPSILDQIEQAEQDAEQAKQDALNALAQANAANAYVDEQVGLVYQDMLALEQATDQIASDLQTGLMAANQYTDTGIASYDAVVQGQFTSIAGQIEQLTAALTSANLVQNGLFALGDASWTLTDATVLARADQTGLAASAPQPNLVELAAASAASISTELNAFTVTDQDRVQFRFFAAATATRTVTVTLAWEDAAGNAVGTPATETLTITPANTWKAYGKQVDPPDTAVGATLTISKASGGAAALITAVEVSTVNVALEARVTQIEATQITEEDVIATIGAQVNSRFGDVESAISDEASTRASETAALASQQTKLSATLDREMGGVINDPYLASSGWVRWAGQGTLVLRDNEAYETGRTWDFTVTAAQRDGLYIFGSPATIWEGQTDAKGYVVEIEHTLVSGSYTGATVLLDWVNTAGTQFRAEKTFFDMTAGLQGLPGRTRTARGVFRKPPAFTGTFLSHNIYVLVNYDGGQMAAKQIKIHRIKIRAATDEELGSGEVMNAVKAELTTNYFTKAETDQAIAGYDFVSSAAFGPTLAKINQSAAAVAGLNGTVARFRNVATVNGELTAAGIEAVAFDNVGGASGSLLKLIGDNVVADGTLSVNKLLVGLGKNLLVDPSFMDGTAHWRRDYYLAEATLMVRQPAPTPDWRHPTMPMLQLYQASSFQNNSYQEAVYHPAISEGGPRGRIAVQEGATYIASCYFSAHRCLAMIVIYFYNTAGDLVDTYTTPYTDVGMGNSSQPDAWTRLHVKAKAPPSANSAIIALRKTGTTSGTNSSLLIWKPQFEETHADATGPSPWSPGDTGMWDGKRLFSDTVLARHIAAEQIEAAHVVKTRALLTKTAQIDDLIVSTAKLGNNAVTMHWSANANYVYFTVAHPAMLTVISNVRVAGITTGYDALGRIRLDSALQRESSFSVSPYSWRMSMQVSIGPVAPGVHCVEHEYARISTGALNPPEISEYYVLVMAHYK